MLLRRIKRTDITAHGFRSASAIGPLNVRHFSRSVCEALAHVVKDKTEGAYFRTDLFTQRCKLMDTWAKFAVY